MHISMKRIISIIALGLCVLQSHAYTEWDIQGNTYRVDTISHYFVGPGTTQTSLRLSGPQEQRVFYTTTDLSNQNVDLKVVKGGNTTRGLETVSNMCKIRNGGNVQYISGVNADFFSMSTPTYPIGNAMVDGEPFYMVRNSSWQSFGLTTDKIPYLGLGNYTATVKANGTETRLSSVNTPRYENYLTLYTHRFGATTETNIYGNEVALMLIDGEFIPGKTAKFKVATSPSSTGNMTIASDGYVLSGNGTASAFVASLKIDDIVEISPEVSFDGKDAGNVTQMVGGQPMIVSNGKVLDTQGAIDHLVNLEPRTAIGFSADKKRLVLLVVDGRNIGTSAGVTSKQLADILIHTGCTEAMNFDGGGSTEMYNSTFGIVNRPSGGTERAVADGLFVVSETPVDNEVAQIRFKDSAMLFPHYAYYKPVIMGYNKYGVLVDADLQGFTLECPAELGNVSKDNSVFCSGNGTHALKAKYGSLETTMAITIGGGSPKLRLEKVLEDGLHGYTVQPYAEVNTIEYALDPQAFEWSSENPAIATVEPTTGFIKGVSNGNTVVHGILDKNDNTIAVTVEKPVAMHAPIETTFDPSTWTVEMGGGKNAVLSAYESGLKLNFDGTSNRSPYFLIKKQVTLWSIPDALRLTINVGELDVTRALIGVQTENGITQNTTIDINLEKNKLNTITIPFSDLLGTMDRAMYPLRINVLRFYMKGQSAGKSYEVLIPGIEAVYNSFSSVESIAYSNVESFIYPNPVESGEQVTIETNGNSAKIFALDGSFVKDVALSISGNAARLSTEGLNSGIYFIVANGKTFKLIIK